MASSFESLVYTRLIALHESDEIHHNSNHVTLISVLLTGTTTEALASKCIVGTTLNFFNPDSRACDVVVLWALSRSFAKCHGSHRYHWRFFVIECCSVTNAIAILGHSS